MARSVKPVHDHVEPVYLSLRKPSYGNQGGRAREGHAKLFEAVRERVTPERACLIPILKEIYKSLQVALHLESGAKRVVLVCISGS